MALWRLETAALALLCCSAEAATDLQQEWARLRLHEQRNELMLCGRVRDEGEAWGAAAYARVAPDCASLFVNARYMARSLDGLAVFLSKPEAGSRQACYLAGWNMGYLKAHETRWQQCEPQLEDARRSALATRVARCRETAQALQRDSLTLGEFLFQNSLGEARSEAETLRKKIFVLVSIGESEKAWEALLASERDEDFSTLPCQVALGLTLAGEEVP